MNKRRNALVPGSEGGSPFNDWTVAHPFYLGVLRWLIDRIFTFSDPAIFLIVGPTGVGKSTMIRQLMSEITSRMAKAMAEDSAIIPYVSAEATYIPGVGVNWQTLFEDMLISGAEIRVDAKVESAQARASGTTKALLRGVNNLLLHRTPALAIVDEGSALVEQGSQKGLEKNLNFLKSLGNRSRTHLAFFGDYKLAEMTQLSGQLNRRCYIAHLPPYPLEKIASFQNVVGKFQSRARDFGVRCELNASSEMLFTGSCGCVGLMHRWLNDAYVEARHRNTVLGHSLLQETAFSDDALVKWRSEITEGANQMKRITKRFEP